MEPALPLQEVTIAEALKPAGYGSAAIGKWHLGGKGFYPEDQGFDVNVGGTHIGMVTSHFYPDWKVTRHGGSYPVGGLAIEGKPAEYLADRLTDAALDFIDQNKDRPFFLYFAHYAVHIPIQAKQEIIKKYEAKVRPDDPQRNPIYAAMVESVDDSVGKVLAKLDQLGLADNTVVFFMSDNGGVVGPQPPNNLPPTSNSPLRAGKGTLYEGGIREPMIVRWPGVVKPNTICSTPVISNDFFPTILAMAGVPLDGHATDGVDLAPLLKQKGSLKRDALYWHFPHYALPGVSPAAAIREGNLKLIEHWEDDRFELFDLAADPGEHNDLAAHMPAKVEQMKKRLHDWQKSVNAQTLVPNPQYHVSAKQ
jgi:arylsulfatase A-like enzyme